RSPPCSWLSRRNWSRRAPRARPQSGSAPNRYTSSQSAALRIGCVDEAFHRAHYAGRVLADGGDLDGRRARRQGRDGVLERADRGRDRAGFAREVALGRADQRAGVAFDLLELRLNAADPAAGEPLDGTLEVGPVRAVSRLAAAAAGQRDDGGRGGKDQEKLRPGAPPAGS